MRGWASGNCEWKDKQRSTLVDNALSGNSPVVLLCYVRNFLHLPCSSCFVHPAAAARCLVVYLLGGENLLRGI